MDSTDKKQIKHEFEVAIHEAFRKLLLGEPDKKLRKVISKSARRVATDIKRYLKDQRKNEKKREREAVRKVRMKRVASKRRGKPVAVKKSV
jgi:hypothetical protein